MAFIIPETNPRAGIDHLLRPDSSTLYEPSSMTSLMPLSDIPEAGFPVEPLRFDFDRQKPGDVELIEVGSKTYYSTEEDYSQSNESLWLRDKTRSSCQFIKPNLACRSNSVGRTTTEGNHHRFIEGSSTDSIDSEQFKKQGVQRSLSCTVIKSPVDKNGNALSFKKPLPRKKNCENFLGFWVKELGKGQERRILSTGEVLDKTGHLKYVVKFLSPLTFRIPQDSGRAIIATLKRDGLYLELDNGEIWVKKEHMFDFSIHKVDNMECCVLL